MTVPMFERLGRRVYDRVSSDTEEPDDSVTETRTIVMDTDDYVSTTPRTDETAAVDMEEGHIRLMIMDPAHRTFKVSASTEWAVNDLKQHGTKIHKVPAASQRLIYVGRLLQDDDTLQDVGLTESKTIIHLFPRPRVVVASSTEAGAPTRSDDGAHIPRIVLDPDEAERRYHLSQSWVLPKLWRLKSMSDFYHSCY